MIKTASVLPLGYSSIEPGQIANVVTCLEMLERPASRPTTPFPPGVSLSPLDRSDPAIYRALYRKIGEDWLWYSRLVMPDDALRAILDDPRVVILLLRKGEEDIGLLELDFRQDEVCELVFFGLVAAAIGQGLGRALMDAALDRAWSQPISRFWVHTCTFDHPAALGFYIRSGFRPYAFQVEVQPDPRLTGHLPRHAAPQVPLIAPP
jgi:GNAT superfamily N-acetyltransferase